MLLDNHEIHYKFTRLKLFNSLLFRLPAVHQHVHLLVQLFLLVVQRIVVYSLDEALQSFFALVEGLEVSLELVGPVVDASAVEVGGDLSVHWDLRTFFVFVQYALEEVLIKFFKLYQILN